MKNKSIKSLLLSLIISLLSFSFVLAATDFDRNIPISLSLIFESEGTNIPNAKFSIYKIADINDDSTYSYTNDFKNVNYPLLGMEDDKWSDLALELDEYLLNNYINSNESKKTDVNGLIDFESINNYGLYLITGEEIEYGGYKYIPSSYILQLPTLDTDDTWIYNVKSYIKFTKEELANVVTYIPVIVDPPVKKQVEGTNRKDSFTYSFKPISNNINIDVEDMPMPEGSSDGIKKVTMQGPGEYEFGEFEISLPGTYIYQISEDKGNYNYVYDTSTYTVEYVVVADTSNNLSATTTITKDGEIVDDIVFVNKYKNIFTIPLTGVSIDLDNINSFYPISIIVLIILFSIYIILRQNINKLNQ